MTETSWINGPFYNFSFYICLQLKSENYGRNFQISIIKARSSNSQDIYPNMLLLSSLKYYFRKKCIPLGNKSQVWKSTEKRRFNLLTYFRYMWVYLYRHRYKNRLWTTSTCHSYTVTQWVRILEKNYVTKVHIQVFKRDMYAEGSGSQPQH